MTDRSRPSDVTRDAALSRLADTLTRLIAVLEAIRRRRLTRPRRQPMNTREPMTTPRPDVRHRA